MSLRLTWLIIIAVLLLAIIITIPLSTIRTETTTPPRFVIVGTHVASDSGVRLQLYVIKDTETNQEILCVYSKTCWLTGRTLK